MLKFPSRINREQPCGAVTRKAVITANALFIRTSVIVDDRLAKVIAVVQGLPVDSRSPCIERLQSNRVCISFIKSCQVAAELTFERDIQLPHTRRKRFFVF